MLKIDVKEQIKNKRDNKIREFYILKTELKSKQEGYEQAISDVESILLDNEKNEGKDKQELDELYKAYKELFDNNEKYINALRNMAKAFMEEIDIEIYYNKYNNMTETELIEYFMKLGGKNE